MPVMKPAQKHEYNTKTAQTHKTNTKQTNKLKKTILQEKIYRSTGAKPLYSEETQINVFKNVPVQRRICFKEATGFLKISLALHTRLAAVTHRAVGEFLHVAVNREEFLTLREGTRIPVVSKRVGQRFKPE
jgi:5-keto 4-deoxyuronate isomerase